MSPAFTRGIGGHQRTIGLTDEWLTPPELIRALGEFDLDPCAPISRPWDTARRQYTILDNGLSQPWDGRVWLNPPYGPQTAIWLQRLAAHGHGTALLFARTETRFFHNLVWDCAHAVLFLRGRISFYFADGSKARNAARGLRNQRRARTGVVCHRRKVHSPQVIS